MSDANLASTAGEVSYIAFAGETNGAYSLLLMTIPPGGGPPPHTHLKEGEGFLVLEGTFQFWMNGKPTKEVGPLGHVFGERGTPHHFKNVGQVTGKLLLIFAPGGCERYFVELGEVRAAGGDELPEKVRAIDQLFGIIIDRPQQGDLRE